MVIVGMFVGFLIRFFITVVISRYNQRSRHTGFPVSGNRAVEGVLTRLVQHERVHAVLTSDQVNAAHVFETFDRDVVLQRSVVVQHHGEGVPGLSRECCRGIPELAANYAHDWRIRVNHAHAVCVLISLSSGFQVNFLAGLIVHIVNVRLDRWVVMVVNWLIVDHLRWRGRSRGRRAIG